MTQLRAEYDTASDERRENRNVGQNRGVSGTRHDRTPEK